MRRDAAYGMPRWLSVAPLATGVIALVMLELHGAQLVGRQHHLWLGGAVDSCVGIAGGFVLALGLPRTLGRRAIHGAGLGVCGLAAVLALQGDPFLVVSPEAFDLQLTRCPAPGSEAAEHRVAIGALTNTGGGSHRFRAVVRDSEGIAHLVLVEDATHGRRIAAGSRGLLIDLGYFVSPGRSARADGVERDGIRHRDRRRACALELLQFYDWERFELSLAT